MGGDKSDAALRFPSTGRDRRRWRVVNHLLGAGPTAEMEQPVPSTRWVSLQARTRERGLESLLLILDIPVAREDPADSSIGHYEPVEQIFIPFLSKKGQYMPKLCGGENIKTDIWQASIMVDEGLWNRA